MEKKIGLAEIRTRISLCYGLLLTKVWLAPDPNCAPHPARLTGHLSVTAGRDESVIPLDHEPLLVLMETS